MSFLGLATGGDLSSTRKDLADRVSEVRELTDRLESITKHIHAVPGASIQNTHTCKSVDFTNVFLDAQPAQLCIPKDKRTQLETELFAGQPGADQWCLPTISAGGDGKSREMMMCGTSAQQVSHLAPALSGTFMSFSLMMGIQNKTDCEPGKGRLESESHGLCQFCPADYEPINSVCVQSP
jgi:hypothetical protein